jgi:hypothetical protein
MKNSINDTQNKGLNYDTHLNDNQHYGIQHSET